MNEQPSKSAPRNQVTKTSKIASSLASGLVARRLQPVQSPEFRTPVQKCEGQVLLRFEASVKTRLGAAGRDRDHIDADAADALRRKQIIGGGEHTFARRRSVLGSRLHPEQLTRLPALPRHYERSTLRGSSLACREVHQHTAAIREGTMKPCGYAGRGAFWVCLCIRCWCTSRSYSG